MAENGVTEQESQEWDFTAHEGDISTDSLSDLESSRNISFPVAEGAKAGGGDGEESEVASQANEEEHATFVFSNGEDNDGPTAPGVEGKVQRAPSGGGRGGQSDPVASDPDDGAIQGGGSSDGVGGGVEGVASSSTQGSLKPWKLHSIQQLMSASSIAAAKKMPRFKWSRFNLRLLEDLLQSLQLCVAKWNRCVHMWGVGVCTCVVCVWCVCMCSVCTCHCDVCMCVYVVCACVCTCMWCVHVWCVCVCMCGLCVFAHVTVSVYMHTPPSRSSIFE